MKRILSIAFGLLLLSIGVFAQTEDKSDKKEKSKKKTIAEITKSCHVIPGLFTMYQDSATGKSYLQIHKDQLGKEFIHFFHVENGAADAGWVKGSYGRESLIKIEEHFDKVRFIAQNYSYYFDADNPLSRSGKANINEPIISVNKVVAKSASKDSLLIESDGLFLSEALVQIKYLPNPKSKAKNPFKIGGLSKEKSHINRLRSYPKNSDCLVTYVFENKYPTNFGRNTITDARYTSIQVQHSFVEMPDNDYEVRYDDPRVGYFITQVTDQTSVSPTPYRDMIQRWHLKKKNPNLAISEPVEPIVYWMENTTPTELRPIVKRAGERWNKAFEKAGFKNAFIIKQQPDDAEWDAGDLRYNVLRWTSAPYTGSAWGPSFVNPRTGQILGTDIMLDYIFIKGRTTYETLFDVSGISLEEMMYDQEIDDHRGIRNGSCNASYHMQQNFIFGTTVSRALGYDDKELEKMLEEYITQLILHEIGHTLGLNHNFKASNLWSPDEINNKSMTEEMGLTSSVMDYSAFNITGDASSQGQYMTTTPGPYDMWAIEFGYAPSLLDPKEEKKRLSAILDRSTEPALAFGNDADDMRSPGRGIDPTINVWDMTSDVMEYGKRRAELCKETLVKLSDELIKNGESYESFRIGYFATMREYFRAMNVVGRYIGGVRIDRAMIGQEGSGQPFVPISTQKQKQAMSLLKKYAFGPEAFMVSKSTYTHLQKQRRGFDHYGKNEDPKIHDQILGYQKALLAHLLHPTVLKRISDSGLYGNGYSVDLVLSDLTDAIFMADAKSHVSSPRRNLQIEYVKGILSGLSAGKYDHLANASMLHEAHKILDMSSKNKSKQASIKAHNEYISYLIERALDKK